MTLFLSYSWLNLIFKENNQKKASFESTHWNSRYVVHCYTNIWRGHIWRNTHICAMISTHCRTTPNGPLEAEPVNNDSCMEWCSCFHPNFYYYSVLINVLYVSHMHWVLLCAWILCTYLCNHLQSNHLHNYLPIPPQDGWELQHPPPWGQLPGPHLPRHGREPPHVLQPLPVLQLHGRDAGPHLQPRVGGSGGQQGEKHNGRLNR